MPTLHYSKVATLSRGLFEASREDQDNLECPHSMDNMSGTDSGISQSMPQGNAAPQPTLEPSDLPRPISLPPTGVDFPDIVNIPAPTVLSHVLLPDPRRPLGYLIPWGVNESASSLTPNHLNDIFVDGFIANTFSPQDAYTFLPQLLRTPSLQFYNVVYSGGAWFIAQNAPRALPQPPGMEALAQHSPIPLDFNAMATQGTVVPQQRWIPSDEADVRRHIAEASLQLPIFFVNRSGGIGFALHDILQGRDTDLLNRDSQGQFGGYSTTHVRINVSLCTLIPIAKGPDLCSPTPSSYHSGRAIHTGSARSPRGTRHFDERQSHSVAS